MVTRIEKRPAPGGNRTRARKPKTNQYKRVDVRPWPLWLRQIFHEMRRARLARLAFARRYDGRLLKSGVRRG